MAAVYFATGSKVTEIGEFYYSWPDKYVTNFVKEAYIPIGNTLVYDLHNVKSWGTT